MASTARTAPTVAPVASSFAETFVCGESRCASQTETCCGAHPDGVCVPSSSDKGAPGSVGSLAPQIEACDKAVEPLGISLTGIDRCDESIDCATDEVCCRNFLHSGSDISECKKLLPRGGSPCDYGERCYEAGSCRIAGADQCVGGLCQKQVPSLSCGGAACPSGTVCCGSPTGCQPIESCTGSKQIRCTKASDCAGDQICAANGYGTMCTNIVFDTGLVPLCNKDADCSRPCNDGSKARCLAIDDVPWLSRCECYY